MREFDNVPSADAALTTIHENITSTHRRLCRLWECALLHNQDLTHHLHEMAEYAALQNGDATQNPDMGDLHSLFLEHRPENNDLPFSPLPENGAALSMLYRTLGTAERITFCRSLGETPTIFLNVFEKWNSEEKQR